MYSFKMLYYLWCITDEVKELFPKTDTEIKAYIRQKLNNAVKTWHRKTAKVD